MTEELSFSTIVGTITGFIVGIILGICVLLISTDNDLEEKDCVQFYKNNNYITESCEIYSDKLEKSVKND